MENVGWESIINLKNQENLVHMGYIEGFWMHFLWNSLKKQAAAGYSWPVPGSRPTFSPSHTTFLRYLRVMVGQYKKKMNNY